MLFFFQVIPPEEEAAQAAAQGVSTSALATTSTDDTNKAQQQQPCDKEPSYDDLLDEDDLEEISDDELEEEKQAKFSVADALDINWSALMDTKPPNANNGNAEVAAGTALKRFRPVNLLSRLGISTKYARPEIVKQVIDTCTNQALLTEDDGKLIIFYTLYFCIGNIIFYSIINNHFISYNFIVEHNS